MADRKRDDRLFGRKDEKKAADAEKTRRRLKAETIGRLCGNADFRSFIFDTLDDLCLYANDEGLLTDFGQGIRAAANRIKTRMLTAKESIAVLAEFAKRELVTQHEGIVKADKEDDN